jgi:hypothetical protein
MLAMTRFDFDFQEWVQDSILTLFVVLKYKQLT